MSARRPKPATFKPGQANRYRVIVSTVSFGERVESVAGFVYIIRDIRADADVCALEYAQRQYGTLHGYKLERVELAN